MAELQFAIRQLQVADVDPSRHDATVGAPRLKPDTGPRLLRFELFPRLPKEIRLKIWQEAANQPRVVEIRQNIDWVYDGEDYGSPAHLYYSPTPLPSIFYANYESRSVAMKDYLLSSSNREDTPVVVYNIGSEVLRRPPLPSNEPPPAILYNPAIDILYFPIWYFEDNIDTLHEIISQDERDKIKRIALDIDLWDHPFVGGRVGSYIDFVQLRNLHELLMIQRMPGHKNCHWCMKVDEPENGIVTLEEFGDRILDGHVVADDWKENEEGGSLTDDEIQLRRACRRDQMMDIILEEFKECKEKNSEWRMPNVKRVSIRRNGILF